MRLADYAWDLLASPSLEAKLRAAPEELTDEPELPCRDRALALRSPGRPAALSFCSDRDKRQAFPKISELGDAEARARSLHFFANHELLAIEIVARALLVFPATPERRADLRATLRDEQRDLTLYINRMAELGVEFGSVPVNDYIWQHARPLDDEKAFYAFFSLTLEGSNIDHASRYARRFEAHGDIESAKVMRCVLRDEIRHVRRGLDAFDDLRDPSEDLFDSFESALQWPMTPVRARGPEVDRAARRKAGMSDAFIDRVARARRPSLDARP